MASLYKDAPTDLSQSIQVIGAGYPRTGTSSFTLALETLLKRPVMHSGSACISREEDFMKSWLSLMQTPTPYSELSTTEREAVKAKLRKVCAGYVGISDAPGVYFVEELADAFPDATIIVTTRDPDKWWKSMEPVAKTFLAMQVFSLLFLPLPTMRYFGKWMRLLSARFKSVYGKSVKMDGPGFLKHHQAYLERTVQSVRPNQQGRIVYFNVKEGWEPLCKALNVPVPDVPFPHANDANAVQEIMQDIIKRALMRWAIIVAGLAVIGYGVMKMQLS